MTGEWLHRAVLRRVPVRGSVKAVLVALADRLDGRRGYRPSLDELSADAGLTVPTVRKAIDQLAAEGWIMVDRGRGRSVRNRYVIAVDRIRALPLLVPDRACTPAAASDDQGGIGPQDAAPITESPFQESPPENCKSSTEKLKAACATGTIGTQKVVVDAHAREADPLDGDGVEVAPSSAEEPPPGPPPEHAEVRTWREELLTAMGHALPGITPAGRVLVQRAELEEARRWETDLGLDRGDILAVIREVVAGKRDGPPATVRYFTAAMRRLAVEKARRPLTLNIEAENHADHHEQARVVRFPQRRPAFTAGPREDPWVVAARDLATGDFGAG